MLLLVDEEEVVLVDSRGGALALQLEDHDSVIMSCRKKIDFRVSRDNPKSIVLPLE